MMNYVSINSGVLMPQIGYGVYQFSKETGRDMMSQQMRIAAQDEYRRTLVAANSRKPRRTRASF